MALKYMVSFLVILLIVPQDSDAVEDAEVKSKTPTKPLVQPVNPLENLLLNNGDEKLSSTATNPTLLRVKRQYNGRYYPYPVPILIGLGGFGGGLGFGRGFGGRGFGGRGFGGRGFGGRGFGGRGFGGRGIGGLGRGIGGIGRGIGGLGGRGRG